MGGSLENSNEVGIIEDWHDKIFREPVGRNVLYYFRTHAWQKRLAFHRKANGLPNCGEHWEMSMSFRLFRVGRRPWPAMSIRPLNG